MAFVKGGIEIMSQSAAGTSGAQIAAEWENATIEIDQNGSGGMRRKPGLCTFSVTSFCKTT